MLVYSVSSLPSFEMVQVIREKILNHLVRFLPRQCFLDRLCMTHLVPSWLTDWLAIFLGYRLGPDSNCRQQERLAARAAPGQPGRRQEALGEVQLWVDGGERTVQRERRQGIRAPDRAGRKIAEPGRSCERREMLRHVKTNRMATKQTGRQTTEIFYVYRRERNNRIKQEATATIASWGENTFGKELEGGWFRAGWQRGKGTTGRLQWWLYLRPQAHKRLLVLTTSNSKLLRISRVLFAMGMYIINMLQYCYGVNWNRFIKLEYQICFVQLVIIGPVSYLSVPMLPDASYRLARTGRVPNWVTRQESLDDPSTR